MGHTPRQTAESQAVHAMTDDSGTKHGHIGATFTAAADVNTWGAGNRDWWLPGTLLGTCYNSGLTGVPSAIHSMPGPDGCSTDEGACRHATEIIILQVLPRR
jgi:hypothetical protein